MTTRRRLLLAAMVVLVLAPAVVCVALAHWTTPITHPAPLESEASHD